MRRFLFSPSISYFEHLVMVVALVVAYKMDFSPMGALVWFGITVAGGFIEGFVSEAIGRG